MLLLSTLAVWAAAEPLCDPETQALKNGECCLLCKPGTRMKLGIACMKRGEDGCVNCGADEYMDGYNDETMCKRQPDCDPNSNFLPRPEVTSSSARHQCQCKEGFHCSGVHVSSDSCDVCVAHTKCPPGSGVTTIGDSTHDTQCEKCPEGTFSNVTSWNAKCRKKTKCAKGEEPVGGGSESDNECVSKSSHAEIIVPVVIALLLLLVVGAVFMCKRKGKTGNKSIQMLQLQPVTPNNGYDELPIKETIIMSPTEDGDELRFPSQETFYSSVPEETDDVTRTDNGDVLSQDGKEYVTPQMETQPVSIY